MAIRFLSGQTIDGTLTVTGNVQAATFNSLPISTGVNNAANQIVRTQGNGYVDFGWINSISGNHTGSITRITASNDQYLRYVTPAQFRTGVTDGFYAPSSTVSGVTSVTAGNGLAGGTITSTGTLSTVHLPSFDTRNSNPDPEDYANLIRFDFKHNSTNGLYDGGTYNGQMTWRAYGGGSDMSGGYPIRLAYTANGNLYRQMGTSATSWGDWNKFALATGTSSQYIRGDGSIATFPTVGSGTVTSVATGSGLTGGTITTTGTLSVDSTVIRTSGNQVITGNTTFYPSSSSTSYSTAAVEIMSSSSGTGGTPPRIGWHWGGVVASQITIESNGTIAVRNNPGNDYEKFKASTITATSSMLSPIYYDAANSAYYGDFASTSVFNKINTGIGNLGSSRSVSYSMTAGNWYRIANGAGRSCGDIYIQDGISGGPHGNLTFYAGSSYAQYAGTMLKLKSSSFYNVIGFTEIRLLIGTTYQDQFVEIYCQRTGTYNITVQDTHSATNQWVLSTSATIGSVPSGYSDSTRLDINGMLIAEAGNGSNRFAVDRVGAIHLSGGSSGTSGQVLTSGGTGSPTWTTLQNQTGGPFLPLAGGTVTGSTDFTAGTYPLDVYGIGSTGSSSAVGLGVYGSTTAGAIMHFHRPGAFAVNFGLDSDNVLRIGGWSAAADRWTLDMSGNNIVPGSFRAPIFYDSNNTGYYVDPASGTNLHTPITFQTNDSTLTFRDAGTNAFQMVMSAGDELYLGSNNNYQLQMNTSGNVNTQGQWRFGANFVKVGNSSTYNSDDGSWGSRFVVASTVHARIDCAQDANAVRASWYTHTGQLYSTFGTVTGHNMRLLSHNATRQILHNGYSAEQGSYRAPIFYDLNDTSYYTDPAGTSNQRNIHIKQGSTLNQYRSGDAAFAYRDARAEGSYAAIYKGTYTGSAYGTYCEYWYDSNSYHKISCANNKFNFDSPISVTGSITASGDVIAYSDKKLKTNIKTLDGTKVLKMRGVSFDRIDNDAKSSGVIAQELQEVAPELITECESDGTLGVSYGNLTGYLIEAIKNQQKQINELTKIIDKLNK